MIEIYSRAHAWGGGEGGGGGRGAGGGGGRGEALMISNLCFYCSFSE